MGLDGLPSRATPDREYLGAILDELQHHGQHLENIHTAILTALGDSAAVAALRPDQRLAVVDIALTEPLTPPPAAGPGSGRAAWAAYAAHHGVAVDAMWARDRIITACREAGFQTT